MAEGIARIHEEGYGGGSPLAQEDSESAAVELGSLRK